MGCRKSCEGEDVGLRQNRGPEVCDFLHLLCVLSHTSCPLPGKVVFSILDCFVLGELLGSQLMLAYSLSQAKTFALPNHVLSKKFLVAALIFQERSFEMLTVATLITFCSSADILQ